MKILILSETYPPNNPGGVGKVAKVISEGLALSGFRVDVVCFDSKQNTIEKHGNLRIFRIKENEAESGFPVTDARKDKIIQLLDTLHSSMEYDIIHDIGGYQFANVIEEFVNGVNIHCISHLLMLMKPYVEARGIKGELVDYFYEFQKKQCKKSDAIIVTSTSDKEKFRTLYPDIRKPLCLIYNCIEIPYLLNINKVNEWRKKLLGESQLVLFFGGRINDPVKGADRIAQFVKNLNDSHIDAKLVGTNLLGVDSNSVFGVPFLDLGRLNEDEFYNMLAAVDFVLCPSRYEAFGMLPAEAESLGVKVIASNIGGLRETVGNIHGSLQLNNSGWKNTSQSTINHINSFVGKWDDNRKITIPEIFSCETIINKIINLYEKIDVDFDSKYIPK